MKYNEEKRRQQIRESNQELRELESKLRTAYISKALAVQKAEKEALLLQQKLLVKQENQELEQQRLNDLDAIKKEREIIRQKKKELREDLERQIITAHQQNQLLYEEFLKEKYYLDEISKKIHQELLEQVQEKILQRERTKKEMEEFDKMKKVFEKHQKIEIEEENQRIREYCQERDRKFERDEKRRKELEKNREMLNEKMVAELSDLEVIFYSQKFLKVVKSICKSGQETVHTESIWQTRSQKFQKQGIFFNRFLVIFERNETIIRHVHFFDDNVHQILHSLVGNILIRLDYTVFEQTQHLLTVNLASSHQIVNLKFV